MINHDGSIKTKPPCDRAVYSVMNQLRDDMSLPLHSSNSQTSSVLNEISPILDTRNLLLKCATHTVSDLSQNNKRNIIDHHRLANNWKIGPEMAKKTLKVTTQRGIRTMLAPTLDRRFKTNDKMLRYSRLNTNMYTDTMFASKTSLRGNTCGQVYTNDIDFTRFYPMKDRKEMPDTLSQFFREEGVPSKLIVDGAREQIGQKVRRACSDANCSLRQLEYDTPWANRAEMAIRELKRGVRRMMRSSLSPLRLWDYCSQLQARIRSSTAHNNVRLDGQVPQTLVDGTTFDISNLAEFGWYDWIKYRDTTVSWPLDDYALGR